MKKRMHKINSDIISNQVRLVYNGTTSILSLKEALNMASNEGLDLIAISDGEIPVVKMEEYSRFVYNIEKKEKEKKKNSSSNILKEIKLSCEIGDNDLNTKSRKALEFLQHGDKVKCIIQFKGRQINKPERGEIVMWKFAEIVADLGLPENNPKLEGNKMIMTLKPKKS
jgi:translation initiation factor IF-3